MQVPVKNMAGQQVGDVELNDAVFAASINPSLMHQALVRQLANARLGLHKTKERGEVAGGGKKPWRQKGTGRARQGSTRAPNFIGGGVVFGPRPRKYTQALPKKMQRAALRSALSVKAEAGQIIVVDGVQSDEYKTRVIAQMLSALGVSDSRVLMVLNEKNECVFRSGANLAKLTTILSGYINVRDLLGHDVVVLSNDAVKHIEQWLGDYSGASEIDVEEMDSDLVDSDTSDVDVEEIDSVVVDTEQPEHSSLRVAENGTEE